MRREKRERGFTLMELMVVIVIVAILAAVAVPLYINYVKDAQRTEAKGAIGAIITAEQAYFLKSPNLNPGAPPTYTDLATLESPTLGLVDIQDAKQKWNFTVTGNTTGFSVTATYITDPSVTVTYNYTQGQGGTFTP
jgi:prepilin-type N-terminal cleavage/methylation domain-containing protein